MKIYLAARYSRHHELQLYAKELTSIDHEITSRWINGSHEISGISRGNLDHKQNKKLALEDYDDLDKADMAIFFTEPPDSKYSRGGRHVEFGIALEQQKDIIVIGFRENVFYFLGDTCLKFCETWDEAFNYIVEEYDTK